ncbi:MAG TPA: HAD family hydrolase [Treponemataceae bacterium]|nr:HAD family hydrolase [Treponemataceae bacterium]HOS35088.1 HAD family hydrolase [Treponemataceae bacterium]HPL90980.1 HAD family hydrolase [Treponemataceae bacterium]HQB89373.1 HAD family hydrolase [Treponemataceae bacterium]HQF73513.1 HAD family hydrolase [Treponemataceae bacterium]
MPKKMTMPVAAIMYDFDKTLCTRDMQEYSFIPGLGISADVFWAEAGKLAGKGMDPILAYMYLMLKKARDADIPIRRENFVSLGHDIGFFPGIDEWFDRIDQYGRECGVAVQHFIISSGLKEIIEGSRIRDKFTKIYACEFHYDANGVADWPLLSVNYTTKTQFLFRINKGVLDGTDSDALNRYVPEEDRPVPFRNMIYIGDGLTDVPCMKLVKANGGHSIAVYGKNNRKKVEELLVDRRVDFLAPADYGPGKDLDVLVKRIIDRMSIVQDLYERHRSQQNAVSGNR